MTDCGLWPFVEFYDAESFMYLNRAVKAKARSRTHQICTTSTFCTLPTVDGRTCTIQQ